MGDPGKKYNCVHSNTPKLKIFQMILAYTIFTSGEILWKQIWECKYKIFSNGPIPLDKSITLDLDQALDYYNLLKASTWWVKIMTSYYFNWLYENLAKGNHITTQ